MHRTRKTHCDICDKRHLYCTSCFLAVPVAEYGPGKGGLTSYSQCPTLFFDSDAGLRAIVVERILGFFEQDRAKANLWYELPNPMLGGISPQKMVECGRLSRLVQFIDQSLAENEPPPKEKGGT